MTALTDDQMARLVDLFYDGVGPAAISRTISASETTVAAAVQRLRSRPWATNVQIRSCPICERRFVWSRLRQSATCSEECHREHLRRYEAMRRAERGNVSTPYVRAWRERHPDRTMGLRFREYDKQRGIPRPLTEEQQQQKTARSITSRRRRNEETREIAERYGEPWTSDEDDFIAQHPELTSAAIALELGRSLHGVHTRRYELRRQRS